MIASWVLKAMLAKLPASYDFHFETTPLKIFKKSGSLQFSTAFSTIFHCFKFSVRFTLANNDLKHLFKCQLKTDQPNHWVRSTNLTTSIPWSRPKGRISRKLSVSSFSNFFNLFRRPDCSFGTETTSLQCLGRLKGNQAKLYELLEVNNWSKESRKRNIGFWAVAWPRRLLNRSIRSVSSVGRLRSSESLKKKFICWERLKSSELVLLESKDVPRNLITFKGCNSEFKQSSSNQTFNC